MQVMNAYTNGATIFTSSKMECSIHRLDGMSSLYNDTILSIARKQNMDYLFQYNVRVDLCLSVKPSCSGRQLYGIQPLVIYTLGLGLKSGLGLGQYKQRGRNIVVSEHNR